MTQDVILGDYSHREVCGIIGGYCLAYPPGQESAMHIQADKLHSLSILEKFISRSSSKVKGLPGIDAFSS
jgi:hypothetical protein